MNYEKSYNNYIKRTPYYNHYGNELLNKAYVVTPAINKLMKRLPKRYMNDIDVNKYTKQYMNDIDVNKYTKQYTNDIDIDKYIKYANDIDIHADINKIYNNEKYLPIKVPNGNGITLIIIKNQLTGEVENEEKDDEERCIEYDKTPPVRKMSFTMEEAREISRKLGIDYNKEKFSIEDFRMGLDVELEHGLRDIKTNVTNDDPVLTGKIALAHLNEFPDYYVRLKKLEDDAKAYWEMQRYIY
jgi:hypothetical protein